MGKTSSRSVVFLYNLRRHALEEIQPSQPDQVLRIYCCGPTVYNLAHIGNFRTFLLQDVLQRLLLTSGYKVKFVRNITDVDDKTISGSQQAGISLNNFTQHWIDCFHRDSQKLNILAPDVESRATEHIAEQIAMIQRLVDEGHAYATGDGSVYFRIASFPDYGKVSGIALAQLESQETNSAGQRNQSDEYSRDHVCDFALWKAYKPEDGDVFWESPWGRGRPGWHIECSAMAQKYLGPTIDIHGGGIDLCFPHHENEVAQSECATKVPFVRHWFHSAHLLIEGQKMSKSLGNIYTLEDLLGKGYDAATVRYALISAHYRQTLNFTQASLEAAQSALKKLRAHITAMGISEAIEKQPVSEWRFFNKAMEALQQDLNTPKCLGELFSVLNQHPTIQADFINELLTVLWILGLYEPLLERQERDQEIPLEITALAEERKRAKAQKQYAEADRLRAQINAKGWSITDQKDGYQLMPN
ncbi:MAG: cysteine--tRNA ligase [Verrucomicrobiota bacterium]|nr:MAG: cysteine--tRNA ligase [Verrucomicrobiota bacterium]